MILHIHFRPDDSEAVEFMCDRCGSATKEIHKGGDGMTLAIAIRRAEMQIRSTGCPHEIDGVVDFYGDWEFMLKVLPPELYGGLRGVLETIGDCDECDPGTQFMRTGITDDHPVVMITHECKRGMQVVDTRPADPGRMN
jgi:hypothetical protein